MIIYVRLLLNTKYCQSHRKNLKKLALYANFISKKILPYWSHRRGKFLRENKQRNWIDVFLAPDKQCYINMNNRNFDLECSFFLFSALWDAHERCSRHLPSSLKNLRFLYFLLFARISKAFLCYSFHFR